jgi:hypothetical protein
LPASWLSAVAEGIFKGVVSYEAQVKEKRITQLDWMIAGVVGMTNPKNDDKNEALSHLHFIGS